MALLGITFFVVFARLLFSLSPIWSDELQRFLMVAMVFVAIPYMASAKSFLVVDLTAIFFSKNEKLCRVMILIGEFIFLILLIYLFFPCLELTVKNRSTYSGAMRMPMAYMYAFMPVSFALGAIGMLKNMVRFFVLERPNKTKEVL